MRCLNHWELPYLIRTLDNQSKKVQDKIDMTMGEAVASAVAREAARSRNIMEKQKEDVWKRAEAATMDRINHDVMMQERRVKLAQWEKELDADNKLEKEGAESSPSPSPSSLSTENHHSIIGSQF